MNITIQFLLLYDRSIVWLFGTMYVTAMKEDVMKMLNDQEIPIVRIRHKGVKLIVVNTVKKINWCSTCCVYVHAVFVFVQSV